ncbi:MAG: hypothetical protein O2979_05670 [Proteobacteria bacterium]|nr:hypothetical protein [Pseudomonadota bacterium]
MATAQILPSVFSSIVFLKIHDFGRRAVVEQTRLRAQLEAAVAVVLPDLKENARIVLDAADGIVLVVLDDPRTALALAERTLAAGAVGLPLSIGINHGAVKLSGKGKNEGLLGDGIAVAAAIAELAGPQKLLVTREFRQALEDAAPGAEAALTGAGTHTDAACARTSSTASIRVACCAARGATLLRPSRRSWLSPARVSPTASRSRAWIATPSA